MFTITTSTDIGEVNLVNPSTKTFTFSNWNIPQTVTLTSVDELLVDGTQVVSITASINSSSDAAFTGLSQTVITTMGDLFHKGDTAIKHKRC